MSSEIVAFFTQFGGTIVGAIGAYVAIRVNLAEMMVRINHLEDRARELRSDVGNLSERIDVVMRRGGK